MRYVGTRCRCGESVSCRVPESLVGERLGGNPELVRLAAGRDLAELKTMSASERVCDLHGFLVCQKCGRRYDVLAVAMGVAR